MKTILTSFALLIFLLKGFGQYNSKHDCTHDHNHGEQCVVYFTQSQVDQLIKEHEANVEQGKISSLRSGNVTPRAYRWLLAYDRKLENKYEIEYIHETIRNNALRLVPGFDNSGILNEGVYLNIIPWDFDEYDNIHELFNDAVTPDHPTYTPLRDIKNKRMDMDMLTLITVEDTEGKGVNRFVSQTIAEAAPSIFWTVNIGVTNFRECILKSITLTHEAGHGLNADHEEGLHSGGSEWYGRAYLENNGDGTYHSIVKSGNILQGELEAFSGPNSYAPKKGSGEIVHLYKDSTTNNAKAVEIMLNHYWTNNIPLKAAIVGDIECGTGTLIASSQNAHLFEWTVMTGDVIIESTSDSTLEFVSYLPSRIRLTAGAEGKDYADTSFIDLPAVDVVAVDTVMTEGSTLPTGEIIASPGTYDVIIEPSNSGDCAYIKRYEVSFATNTSELFQSEIMLSPNPVTDILYIDSKLDFDRIDIYNVLGQRVRTGTFRQALDVSSLPAGKYRILINGNIIKSFVKI